MFLRETARMVGGKKIFYLLLVENKRVQGKTHQTVIHSFGNKDDLIASGKYDEIWERFGNPEKRPATMPLDAIVTSSRHFGYDLLLSTLWKKLNLFNILNKAVHSTKIQYNFSEAIYCMVLNRLLDPGSKQHVMLWKDTIARESFLEVTEQSLYRSLDQLTINMDTIEEDLFKSTQKLISEPLDLVLFDTTATYFEGDGHATDMLQLGHSKDHRSDRKQIVVGVLMTSSGIPVSHAVFDGNSGDAPIYRGVLEDFKGRFKINQVIMAADRGMVGSKTYETLSNLGYPYILGSRFRNEAAAQEAIAAPIPYEEVYPNLQVKDVTVNSQRYIVCFNPEEAKRAKAVREEIIETLERKLARQSGVKELVNNRGYRKWVRVEGTASVDNEKIDREAQYDGIYVLKTDTDLPAREVALSYKKLWKIERGFRDLKTELGLRPVYHWTEYRICGHVAVCFLALYCDCLLDYLIHKEFPELNSCNIQKEKHAISELHSITFEKNGQKWVKKALNTSFLDQLLAVLK